MQEDKEAYNQLAYYTLTHPDPYFIHQLIVDAFTAQFATKDTKPIAITFALVGLYLVVEKGFTGKEVQNIHIQMAKKRKTWPTFPITIQKGEISIYDVLAKPEGKERDEMIKKWCSSVWDEWKESQHKVRDLVNESVSIL